MILSKFWFLQFANLQNSRFTFKSVSSLNANLQTWQICPSHCKLQVLSHFYKLQRLSLQCGWLLKVPNSLVFNIRSMVLLGGLLLSDATQFLEDAPTFRHLLFFPFHYICDSTHGSYEQSNYHRRTHKHVESQRKLLRKCPHHQFGRWHGKWRPGNSIHEFFCTSPNQKPIRTCAVAGKESYTSMCLVVMTWDGDKQHAWKESIERSTLIPFLSTFCLYFIKK